MRVENAVSKRPSPMTGTLSRAADAVHVMPLDDTGDCVRKGAAMAPDAVPSPPFAAAVYPSKAGDRNALHRFVRDLQETGVDVAGILQLKVPMDDGEMMEVMAVDIRTGESVSINRPTRENWKNQECSLDVAALAETTSFLLRAIEDRGELVVVEKFGDAEIKGGGLCDEILNGIASGIPFLVAVPENNLQAWNERTGGIGATLVFDETVFRNWWLARGAVQI